MTGIFQPSLTKLYVTKAFA